MGLESVDLLHRLSGARVLCVGDMMLDRYIYGSASRISPEAPVPVVTVGRRVLTLGGVGNVARNLSDCGVATQVASVVGEDKNADLAEEFLNALSVVRPILVRDPSRPTSIKTRVIAGIQQVVRYDEEVCGQIEGAVEFDLLRGLAETAFDFQAIAVSDYGKGVVTAGLFRSIREMTGLPIVVDPKGYDYSRYAGADLVKPNLKELCQAAGRNVTTDEEIAAAGRMLLRTCGIKNMLITRSEKGMVLLQESDKGESPVVLPSRAREVFDVTGAGDTVLAFIAASMAVGAPLYLAARLATFAAGVVVGKLGTATATPKDIEKYIREL